MGLIVLITLIVVLAVAYQVYVSRQVYRAPYYSNQQKWVQTLMIWAVPIIGASLCHFILSDAEATDVASGGSDAGFDGNDSSDGGGDGGEGD